MEDESYVKSLLARSRWKEAVRLSTTVGRVTQPHFELIKLKRGFSTSFFQLLGLAKSYISMCVVSVSKHPVML